MRSRSTATPTSASRLTATTPSSARQTSSFTSEVRSPCDGHSCHTLHRKQIRQGLTMKRILLTAVSLGTLAALSPALAADLPMKAPSAVASVYDWTGVYIGGFGGGGFGNHNYTNSNGPVGFTNFTVNYDSTGGIGGGEVGYNWQSGSALFGVEADGFWSGIKGSDASQALGVVDQTSLKWGGTLRAR